MEIITEDYVSFETAKLLKDKGFNYPCRAVYSPKGTVRHYLKEEVSAHNLKGHKKLCPTLQMAMKWLRVKGIIIIPKPKCFNKKGKCSVWDCSICLKNSNIELQSDFNSYEEACETAIKCVLSVFVIK